MRLNKVLIKAEVPPTSVECPIFVTVNCAHIFDSKLLTPSLPQPGKFPGWKMERRACKQYIFRSFFFFLAKHIIVGRLFRNIHPSLQYSSHSRIHTSLYDFFPLTCTTRTMPLPLGYSVHNFHLSFSQ